MDFEQDFIDDSVEIIFSAGAKIWQWLQLIPLKSYGKLKTNAQLNLTSEFLTHVIFLSPVLGSHF